jgi:hypothetical protein
MLARRLWAIFCLLLLPHFILPAAPSANAEELPLALDVDPAKRALAKHVDREGYLPAASTPPCETCEEQEPNDTPETANTIFPGVPLGATLTPGDVDWFVLTCDESGYVRFTTYSRDGSSTDTVLRVHGEQGSVLIGQDDDGGLGLYSTVPHMYCEAGSSLYVEVVHFNSAGSGTYAIVAEGSEPPPPVPTNDELASFLSVDCNGVTEGTTVGSTNQVGRQIECVDYLPLGGDVFYRVVLPYSYQLTVQVTPLNGFDPSVYLFTDVQDPWQSCFAGSDEGFASDAEIVTFINEDDTSEEMEIFVAVDSWSRHSAGNFLLSIGCEFVIPTETTSWSNVKSRF